MSAMSEHRSERVIEGEARPEWGRLPVAAVVVVSFLLAAIVGMTSAASPWVPATAAGSSPPRDRRRGARRCPCRRPLHPAGADLDPHAPTPQARKKPGGPRSPPTSWDRACGRARSSWSVGFSWSLALVIAFWFLLGQADQAQPPPPSATTVGDAAAAASGRSRPRPHRRSSTGSSSGWSPRSRSSCPSRSLPAAGFG